MHPIKDTAQTENQSRMEKGILERVKKAKEAFDSGRTIPYEYRLEQLKGLGRLFLEKRDDLLACLKEDFKSESDAKGELMAVEHGIMEAINKLKEWMKPESVPTPMAFWMDKCEMRWEPLGVTLIIAPWNYPIDLLITPLVGAISAGCTAILKPSELTPTTSTFLSINLPKYVDPDAYALIEGGPRESSLLIEQSIWGIVFFTGSERVGRIVQSKAAANLIPTILELGGKSPVIVDSDSSDLKTTAKRIIYGKLFNAGQTCVAPDYVLLTDPTRLDEFGDALKEAIIEFYGEDPCKSVDYSRIVNEHHYERLKGLIPSSERSVIRVGEDNEMTRYLAPTLILLKSNELKSLKVMNEEIFGPILPVLTTNSVKEAIKFVNERPYPLATYIFSSNPSVVEKCLGSIKSGGCTVNDTVMHVFSQCFPLGGVGPSGMGKYRGHYSFEAFSHKKPVMWRSMRGEIVNDYTRNPPMNDTKARILQSAVFTPLNPHKLQ